MIKLIRNICLCSIVITLLTACATTPDTGPNYYLLSSGDLSSQALNMKSFKLALGPVDVPAHLDREGIATLDGKNQLNYSDGHRWAEPLNENLIKTLYANLAKLLPKQQLIEFPYRQSNRPDYQLSVDIEKFGYLNDGSVVLKARSVLLDARGRQIDSDYIDLLRELNQKDYAEIVSIMSELLAEMASRIANRLADKL